MNVKAIAGKIGLDWEEALEYYGGDINMLKEKLTSFEDDTSFDALRKAIEEKDSEMVAKGAHKIKKASEKVGLKNLARIAGELENSKGLKETPLFLELEKEYQKVITALKEC